MRYVARFQIQQDVVFTVPDTASDKEIEAAARNALDNPNSAHLVFQKEPVFVEVISHADWWNEKNQAVTNTAIESR